MAENTNKGILYLVSTPIGNLKDITLRAIETLKESDVILAEDTRVSIKLLNHYEIKKKLISFHKFNELQMLLNIKNLLNEGKKISLISDAGSPLISDPGIHLIPKLLNENYKVIPIPGPTAIIPAIQMSGLVKDKFLFMGFFPIENKEINDTLEFIKSIKNQNIPLFFYESPHKINKTLKKLQDYFGNIDVTIYREITKKFEQRISAPINTLLKEEFKGEIVFSLLLENKEEIDNLWINIKSWSEKYIKQGFSKKDIAKILSVQFDIKKNLIYKYLIDNWKYSKHNI